MPTPHPRYLAREDGLFPLIGGPLCGLRADAPNMLGIVELHYEDLAGVCWLVCYRFDDKTLKYHHEGERRVAWA